MPFARCKWYEGDGTPIKNGCRRVGSGCEFIHPNEASWNAAPPPRARTGDGPFHGHKENGGVPTTGTNPSAVDSGWGNRRGRGRGRGGVPTAPHTPRTDPSDIGGGASSGTVDISSGTLSGWATIDASNTSSTTNPWGTVDAAPTVSGWGNADTAAGWGSVSGGGTSGQESSSADHATGWGSWGASSSNGDPSGWGATTSSSVAEGWGIENSSGPSSATAPGGWGSSNENLPTWGATTSNSGEWGTNATTSSPGVVEQGSAWGPDLACASTGKRKGKERETTGWPNSGIDGDWVMEEANPVITSANDIATLPSIVLSPLHTPEDIGTTKLPPTPRQEDVEIVPLDLAAVTEHFPDCILDIDSGDPYMQYIKTFVKSILHYCDYEIAKADLLKHKKLRGAPRNTHSGPRGQEIMDVVENLDTARCEDGKKNRDDVVCRLEELTMMMNSSSAVVTDEEVAEIERYAAQAKDWLQKVRNAVEMRNAVIAQDVETVTVWDKLARSMDDFEERLSDLYRFHDDLREHSQDRVMENIETLIVKKVIDIHESDIIRIQHDVDSIRAQNIEEQQNGELDAIRAEQEAFRKSIAELEASFSKAEVDLNELLDGASKATRNLECLQIPAETSPASLIRFENLAREVAVNEFNFASAKLKEAVRERLEVDGEHITDTAWRQLQPMMTFTIRVSQALDKVKEAEGTNSRTQPTVTAPS